MGAHRLALMAAAALGCCTLVCLQLGVHGVKVHVAGASSRTAHLKTPWQHWFRSRPAEMDVVSGMRIPRRFFVTKGFGETDEGTGADPFETGAHDLAMESAGIHNFNLMTYTSILPPEAEEISFDEAKAYFHHGSVLECILAEIHGGRGDRVTAGVGRMMVRDRTTGVKRPMGGFAVEYEGHAAEETARKQLDAALGQLFDRRFTTNSHEHLEKEFTIESRDIEKAFGTAMAGICFVDYVTPVYSKGKAELKSEL